MLARRVGDCDAARERVGETLAAPSSRKCGGRWDPDFEEDRVFVGDPVACGGREADAVPLGVRLTALDRVGERVDALERVGVRVPAGDFDGVDVARGDRVGDTGTHPPQVEGAYPTTHVP